MTDAIAGMRWQDVVDIVLITFVFYRLYVWIQGSRALRILIALLALGVLYVLARWAGLFVTSWILQYLWAVILVIIVVVFQGEIRRVLERMSPLRFFLGRPQALDQVVLEAVVRTAFDLAQKRIGALMVFKRYDLLEEHTKGGIPVDGRVSYEVLSSIFYPHTPAHDGAVIIQSGRIDSVGCVLPLSDNPALPQRYGTRHRAGIGITERCDAISLIVSEERGEVSLAVEGRIHRIENPEALKMRLESIFVLAHPQVKGSWWRIAFTKNLVPKLISLILVLILWGFIGGQPRAEIWVTVPLEYRNMPTSMEIVGEMASRVEVGIRGPRGLISNITPDQVKAHVELSQALRGLNYVRLTEENIRVPLGTEITKINPPSIRIRLEDIKSLSIPVKAHFIGKLPRPLRLKTVSADPASIVLQGPEGALKKIREIFTEPIDLSEIREDVQLTVGIEVNSPQVRLASGQPSQVAVNIELEKTK